MAKNEQVSMEDLKVAYDKDSKRQATFTFNGEDHTLGNLLRSVVSTNKKVEFCAYSVPHPCENLMNVRIQLSEGNAVDVLEKGLKRTIKIADIITEKFSEAVAAFENKMVQ